MTFIIQTFSPYEPEYGPPEPCVCEESPDDDHWLVMDWRADCDDEGPYIEHPMACAIVPGGWDATACGVGWEEGNAGIPDEMWPREPGRWRIEFWHEFYPSGPWGGPEANTGLRWIEEEPRFVGRRPLR